MHGRVWINFKELRARLNAEAVLRLYKVEVHRKGEQHQGECPLPSHKGRGELPFSMNLERGIFQCFGCKAKGNVLEFAALMEGVDLQDGNALRKVAVKLQAKFFPEGASTKEKEPSLFPAGPEPTRRDAGRPQPVKKSAAGAKAPARNLPVKVNAPLDFELQGLDPSHAHLVGLGLAEATIAHFGLGYCSRGMLKERVAIPLGNPSGQLIGYAGLVVGDGAITDENPRLLFPSKRERNGVVFDFQRSLFLYNGSRLDGPCDDLAVVEDFSTVWWLHQNGIQNVVATMDAEVSEQQIDLLLSLVERNGRVWIVSEKEGLAQSLMLRVGSHCFVRWLRPKDGRLPTDLSPDELESCFSA